MSLGHMVDGKFDGLCCFVNQKNRYDDDVEVQKTDTIYFEGNLTNQHFNGFCGLMTSLHSYSGDYKNGMKHGLGSLKFGYESKYICSGVLWRVQKWTSSWRRILFWLSRFLVKR